MQKNVKVSGGSTPKKKCLGNAVVDRRSGGRGGASVGSGDDNATDDVIERRAAVGHDDDTSDSLREHRRQAVATAGTAGAARLLVDDVVLGRLVAKQLAFGAGCLQQAGANESLMARVLLFGFLAFSRQLFARSKSVAGQHAFASCFGPGRDPIFVHWTDEM